MEDNKIPDAWDLISKAPNSGYNERESSIDWDDIQDIMIEFAKLHVKAALKAAVETKYPSNTSWVNRNLTDMTSIINAYNLENIK